MKLEAICVDNSAFEDIMTTGKTYQVYQLCPTGSSVVIKNDKGELSSHGLVNLNLKFTRSCSCKKPLSADSLS